MKAKRRNSSKVLIIVLLGYVFATLPLIQTTIIVVFGILTASVLRSYEDTSLYMFALFARLITNARNKAVPSTSPLRNQILKVCASIDQYPGYMSSVIYRKRQLFFMLNKTQQHAASRTYQRLIEIDKLKNSNVAFLTKVKQFAMKEFDIAQHEIEAVITKTAPNIAYEAVELLEHFVRDWSVHNSNQKARAELLEPFIKRLKGRRRILVPGFGLGRLAAELASECDTIVDAPEMSASMWLGAKYATSQLENPEETDDFIYPFLLQFSYWRKGSDQLEPVPLLFPPHQKQPNFVYADFLKYNIGTKYDAVATLYFIDTAQNIFAYIDRIADSLAPGGIWCNYGPLKWGSASFVEFSVDELVAYMKSSGWQILELWDQGSNRYNGSEKSMLYSKYELIGWVAQRT